MTRRSLPVPLVVAASLLAALAMVALPARAQAPAARGACIEVEVQNVRPDQGSLMVAAYDGAATFSKAPVVATQMRVAAETMMRFPLCGLAGPSVALTLYQDLNGNGKLDSNAFGVPTEPWGASGRPPAMSAPTWETTAVPVDVKVVTVTLSK